MELAEVSNLIEFRRYIRSSRTTGDLLEGAILTTRVVNKKLIFFVWQGDHRGHFIHLVKLNGMFTNEFISLGLKKIDYPEISIPKQELYKPIFDSLIEGYLKDNV